MNKILIAEDDPAIANLIRTALDGPDYRCGVAADGLTAADLLEKETFDLALLDIMLPGADGYEVLEYCRTLEVPVIFLTAKGTVEDRVKGLRLGAEDYITKPFELMELMARVETVLRRCGKTGRVLALPPDIEIDTAAHTVRQGGVESRGGSERHTASQARSVETTHHRTHSAFPVRMPTLGGKIFSHSLQSGGQFANDVIGMVARGDMRSTGSITGDLAAQSLQSYMGHTALGTSAAEKVSYSQVER